MGSVIELARNAGIPTELRGGLVLVSAADVDRLLGVMESRHVRVLGVEAFDISGADVTPDMNAILDLSDVDDPAESIRESRTFFEHMDTSALFFDFVIDEATAPPQ